MELYILMVVWRELTGSHIHRFFMEILIQRLGICSGQHFRTRNCFMADGIADVGKGVLQQKAEQVGHCMSPIYLIPTNSVNGYDFVIVSLASMVVDRIKEGSFWWAIKRAKVPSLSQQNWSRFDDLGIV